MIHWLRELDEALRGRKADPRLLAEGTAHIHIQPLVVVSVALGMIYGVCMGLYAVATRTPPSFAQLVTSAVKVPALFFLTLVVTFPSLYVFSALLGVRLGPKDTFRLILVPIVINLAVLASLGPITAFFTLSTTSYPFMKLLNVFFFTVAGIIGLKVLLAMLSSLEAAQSPPPATMPDLDKAAGAVTVQSTPQPLAREKTAASRTFLVWVVIYALVGAQMGWILRPFIGRPDLPFQLFRGREANFFVDVLRTLAQLLGQ
ncbi:MAG: hypothetical protein EHM35_05860 [Planctomycetaceae bacterium]|nr:MAG: hypothetical protein EHM35_05860 [Planctomycetaceae bacterium]